MRRPGRRTVLGVAALVVLALAGGVVALVLALRGSGPEAVAQDYLRAQWSGDWRAECDLATLEWRDAELYGGHPFADCAAYADAAKEASTDNPFLPYADDTDVEVTVQALNEEDGRARVEYVVELRYHGEDQSGFDELWQGGGAYDRGTVELVEVDGDWRVAGVDAG
ncbi:hypothetical protein CFH99_21730 [Nocardioides aromaticivorans]|uniref:Uncharacterized protein n=1 Tax=Nocardioides aromaticivorans TaxID=200618 RepID=A0ABX7PRD6_9ACTN|nr:hypothetical protein [Nocardioides aromaticivorans]QSR28247.1 hypothetical protein CFH99_21730 [Nocardioides aromaticivorans]